MYFNQAENGMVIEKIEESRKSPYEREGTHEQTVSLVVGAFCFIPHILTSIIIEVTPQALLKHGVCGSSIEFLYQKIFIFKGKSKKGAINDAGRTKGDV